MQLGKSSTKKLCIRRRTARNDSKLQHQKQRVFVSRKRAVTVFNDIARRNESAKQKAAAGVSQKRAAHRRHWKRKALRGNHRFLNQIHSAEAHGKLFEETHSSATELLHCSPWKIRAQVPKICRWQLVLNLCQADFHGSYIFYIIELRFE